MRRSNEYLDRLIQEFITAADEKNFTSMSEIYNEIAGLENIQYDELNIFFSELEENHSIKLPYKIKGLEGKDILCAVVYKKNNCLELYYTSLDLEDWQRKFMKDDASAICTEVSVISSDRIEIDKEIQQMLEMNIGDIIVVHISDSIVISKLCIDDFKFLI